MGQVSGIIFILGMDLSNPRTGSMTLPLLVLVGLMVVSLVLCTRLREATALRPQARDPHILLWATKV